MAGSDAPAHTSISRLASHHAACPSTIDLHPCHPDFSSFLIFIGTAIIIGAVAGGILHIMSRGFASLLGAGDLGDENAQRAATRTLADYRKARQRRKVEDERAARSVASWASNPVGDASGLVRSTILEEEEDSEF
ncbi:hypothetical protein FH972_024865 [Carpinus fangiana]|uniref:Uncharacterized protein n=1 Tax=Carpinus fangiana TaxID=176857 RepID=A0A5N6KZY3_9ROSI|nr:hypothetical protein FH972_024865 [Carpinus fangiana]